MSLLASGAPRQEEYFRHGPHLAVYRRVGDLRDHWDRQWAASVRSFLRSSRSGLLGEFEHPFISYLPREGRILEAGCGTGRYVCALRARGYDVEGIDYARETVRLIESVDPSLPIRFGDILAVDRPDGYYSGYISIGVVEHRYAGPEAALREAHRVLKPNGIAVITVPQLNHARRRMWRRAREAAGPTTPDGLDFYQDHLSSGAFAAQLRSVGFVVEEVFPYELFGGLIRDWSWGRYLNARGFYSWRARRLIRRLCELAPRSIRLRHSHMLAFVCRRRPNSQQLGNVAT